MHLKSIKIFFTVAITNAALMQPSYANERWAVFSNPSTPTFIVEASINDHYDNPQEVKIVNENDLTQPKRMLSKYYWMLANKKTSELVQYYLGEDGSRERFQRDLTSGRLNLDSYSNLAAVFIREEFSWDGFYFYSVQLQAKSGQKQTWVETVFCNIECKMVFDFLSVNLTSEVADIIRASYWSSFEEYGDQSKTIKLDKVTHSVEVKPALLTGRLKDESKLIVHLSVNQVDKNTLIDARACDPKKDHLKKAVCNFLEQINIVDTSDAKNIEKLTLAHWGEKTPEVIRRNFGAEARGFFSLQALVSEYKKIDSLKILGSIKIGRDNVLLFRPLVNGNSNKLPIQHFFLSYSQVTNEYKVDFGNENKSSYRLFSNQLFMDALAQVLDK